MKKAFIVFAAVLFVVSFTVPLYALPHPIEKLYDGGKTVLKSPLQVVDHTTKEVQSAQFKPFGLIGGFLKGTAYMVHDIVSGVYTMVTCPIDTSK